MGITFVLSLSLLRILCIFKANSVLVPLRAVMNQLENLLRLELFDLMYYCLTNFFSQVKYFSYLLHHFWQPLLQDFCFLETANKTQDIYSLKIFLQFLTHILVVIKVVGLL